MNKQLKTVGENTGQPAESSRLSPQFEDRLDELRKQYVLKMDNVVPHTSEFPLQNPDSTNSTDPVPSSVAASSSLARTPRYTRNYCAELGFEGPAASLMTYMYEKSQVHVSQCVSNLSLEEIQSLDDVRDIRTEALSLIAYISRSRLIPHDIIDHDLINLLDRIIELGEADWEQLDDTLCSLGGTIQSFITKHGNTHPTWNDFYARYREFKSLK